MRRLVALLTLLAAVAVIAAGADAAGLAISPTTWHIGDTGLDVTVTGATCSGTFLNLTDTLGGQDQGGVFPTASGTNLVQQDNGSYEGQTPVSSQAKEGTHTITVKCSGTTLGTVTITATHATTPTPSPMPSVTAVPSGTPGPNAPKVAIAPTTFQRGANGVAVSVSNTGCTAYDLHLEDKLQESDKYTNKALFDGIPTLLDSGDDGSAADDDGIYPGTVNVASGAAPGPHTLDVICGTKLIATVDVTASGTPAGPHNAAPTTHLHGVDLRVAWTYAKANPFKEAHHSGDLTVTWPGCHSRGGTKVIFSDERIFGADSVDPPTLKHTHGNHYAGGAYVSASVASGGLLHIHKIRCVKGSTVKTYGTLDAHFHKHTTSGGPGVTAAAGKAKVIAIAAPRCRDGDVDALTISSPGLTPSSATLARVTASRPATFGGSVTGAAAGTYKATLRCGQATLGTVSLTVD